MKPPMDANERELILKEEVYAVVGCAIEVLTKEPRMNANQRQLEEADFQASPQRP
jgi:hypothetical protein